MQRHRQTARQSTTSGDDDTCRVLAVNVRVAFLCACDAIKHVLDDGKTEAIVTVSNVHQIILKPRFLAYSVS
jgi:glucose 1-dehydrogenase